MKFPGDCCPAHHRPPLQDERAPAGTGEIEGGDEAVVARAYDDDILIRAHLARRPSSDP